MKLSVNRNMILECMFTFTFFTMCQYFFSMQSLKLIKQCRNLLGEDAAASGSLNGVSKCHLTDMYVLFVIVYLLDLGLLCFLFFVAFLRAPLKLFGCKLEVKQIL